MLRSFAATSFQPRAMWPIWHGFETPLEGRLREVVRLRSAIVRVIERESAI